jgi:hypothetical protein
MELAANPPAARAMATSRSRTIRSKVTNGSALFVDGDDRSVWARRYRDLIFAHTSDLGGSAAVSEAQAALIRRAATLQIELEGLEAKLSLSGGPREQGRKQHKPPESLRLIAANCLAMAARFQPTGSEATPSPEYGYWLTAAREALKAESSHQAVTLEIYGRTVGHLRRVLEALGLERKARDVTADGVEIEPPFSPMRARWQAEAEAAAKHEVDAADAVEASPP